MIYYKTEDEIDLIRESSLLVAKTHAEVAKHLKAGITSSAIDKIAEDFIRANGGEPAFKGYRGFPGTLCVSVNEQVVHGIPSDYVFKNGDIVSLDCGVVLNGFYGDSAYTYAIGEIDEATIKLLQVTKEALYKGIEQAVAGKRLGDISFAIQEHTEKKYGYGVVRELVGHGIGRNLHEDPEVPNYGKRGKGVKLKEGLVLAIEPMINLGKRNVQQDDDGWTIITADRKPSAHFEHTIVVRKQKAEILSSFEIIEEAIKANAALSLN